MKLRVAILALCAMWATSAHAGVFYPETFTLDNGLEIIVVPNHLAPAVTQMVWYKIGAADEVAGKSGIAHYLEHLMFRGTTTLGPGQFSKKIAAQGGSENAFTSYDYTAFHEIVAADRLAMVMQMEADRMRNLNITPVTATPELSVVLDERQQRTDNNPEGKFEERVHHTLMPDYPYGIPVIGWKQEIEKLTADDAIAWYKRYYAPNNAVVVISGDVTVDEVKKLAADTYAKIPAGNVPPRKPFPPLKEPANHRLEVTDAGVEQPQVEFHVMMPSYNTEKEREAYATEVLAETLDGGEVGVLYRDLVAGQGIASGADTNYDPDMRGDSTFTIAAVPQPGKDPAMLEKALHDELAKLAKDGLSAKSVEDAKKRLARQAIFARDNLMAPGYVYGESLATGHTVQIVEEWPDRISAVTPDQVNAMMRRLASDPHYIYALLLPDKTATAAQKAAARPTMMKDQSIR